MVSNSGYTPLTNEDAFTVHQDVLQEELYVLQSERPKSADELYVLIMKTRQVYPNICLSESLTVTLFQILLAYSNNKDLLKLETWEFLFPCIVDSLVRHWDSKDVYISFARFMFLNYESSLVLNNPVLFGFIKRGLRDFYELGPFGRILVRYIDPTLLDSLVPSWRYPVDVETLSDFLVSEVNVQGLYNFINNQTEWSPYLSPISTEMILNVNESCLDFDNSSPSPTFPVGKNNIERDENTSWVRFIDPRNCSEGASFGGNEEIGSKGCSISESAFLLSKSNKDTILTKKSPQKVEISQSSIINTNNPWQVFSYDYSELAMVLTKCTDLSFDTFDEIFNCSRKCAPSVKFKAFFMHIDKFYHLNSYTTCGLVSDYLIQKINPLETIATLTTRIPILDQYLSHLHVALSFRKPEIRQFIERYPKFVAMLWELLAGEPSLFESVLQLQQSIYPYVVKSNMMIESALNICEKVLENQRTPFYVDSVRAYLAFLRVIFKNMSNSTKNRAIDFCDSICRKGNTSFLIQTEIFETLNEFSKMEYFVFSYFKRLQMWKDIKKMCNGRNSTNIKHNFFPIPNKWKSESLETAHGLAEAMNMVNRLICMLKTLVTNAHTIVLKEDCNMIIVFVKAVIKYSLKKPLELNDAEDFVLDHFEQVLQICCDFLRVLSSSNSKKTSQFGLIFQEISIMLLDIRLNEHLFTLLLEKDHIYPTTKRMIRLQFNNLKNQDLFAKKDSIEFFDALIQHGCFNQKQIPNLSKIKEMILSFGLQVFNDRFSVIECYGTSRRDYLKMILRFMYSCTKKSILKSCTKDTFRFLRKCVQFHKNDDEIITLVWQIFKEFSSLKITQSKMMKRKLFCLIDILITHNRYNETAIIDCESFFDKFCGSFVLNYHQKNILDRLRSLALKIREKEDIENNKCRLSEEDKRKIRRYISGEIE